MFLEDNGCAGYAGVQDNGFPCKSDSGGTFLGHIIPEENVALQREAQLNF